MPALQVAHHADQTMIQMSAMSAGIPHHCSCVDAGRSQRSVPGICHLERSTKHNCRWAAWGSQMQDGNDPPKPQKIAPEICEGPGPPRTHPEQVKCPTLDAFRPELSGAVVVCCAPGHQCACVTVAPWPELLRAACHIPERLIALVWRCSGMRGTSAHA